jgi:hypothetical protein
MSTEPRQLITSPALELIAASIELPITSIQANALGQRHDGPETRSRRCDPTFARRSQAALAFTDFVVI